MGYLEKECCSSAGSYSVTTHTTRWNHAKGMCFVGGQVVCSIWVRWLRWVQTNNTTLQGKKIADIFSQVDFQVLVFDDVLCGKKAFKSFSSSIITYVYFRTLGLLWHCACYCGGLLFVIEATLHITKQKMRFLSLHLRGKCWVRKKVEQWWLAGRGICNVMRLINVNATICNLYMIVWEVCSLCLYHLLL